MKVTLSSKKEIIGELAKRSHVTRELAGYVYHNLLDIILERLKKGEESIYRLSLSLIQRWPGLSE